MSVWDAVVHSITPQVIGALSSGLEEPGKAVQGGLQVGSAAILHTLASRSDDLTFLNSLVSAISARDPR